MAEKRERGEGTLLERKRHADGTSTWRLRYRVDGARYSTTYRGTKTDARKELRRLLKSGDDGEHVAPARLTLKQWEEKWAALLERKPDTGGPKRRKRGAVGARALERYRELMRLHVLPTLGNRPIQKVRAPEIDELYLALEDKGLSPGTVRYVHIVLGSCFGMAARKGLITSNPVEKAEAPIAGESEAGTVLEQDELDALVKGFRGHSLYPIVCVAAYTGARRGEVLALRWADVDLDRKAITIARAVEETKAHGLVLKDPKSERGRRTITIDDGLVGLLRREREQYQRIKAGVAEGDRARVNLSLVKLPADALVFPALPGPGEGFSFAKLRNPRHVTKAFALKAAAIGYPVRLHDLRGTHGTLLLDANVPVHTVAARLGHDPAILLKNYAKRTKKGDATAALAIGAISRAVLG